jgi:para-nitrobenzyl esterase
MSSPFSNPRVKVKQGVIKGVHKNKVISFFSVPFAAPPTGDLRWKPPQPALSWSGVRDCTVPGPAALQDQAFDPPGVVLSEFTANIFRIAGVDPKDISRTAPSAYSEDCLFLDIYVPEEAILSSKKKLLPIMVWFHGGAHRSGNSIDYDGSTLCNTGNKCIVICAQYRLGLLGFFSHPELNKEQGGASGNYGLMDHVAALEWVKHNGSVFGGDSSNVTIFGESAGGSSCSALMIAPSAKGLFHRAISQSGLGLRAAPPATTASKAKVAKKGIMLQNALQVGSLAELRDIPGEVLMKMASKYGTNELVKMAAHGGVISDGNFLPEHGIGEAFKRGEHHNVPFIVGFNALEGGSFFPVMPVPAPEAMIPELVKLIPVNTYEKYQNVMKHLTHNNKILQDRLTEVFSRDIEKSGNIDATAVTLQTKMIGDTLFGAPSELLASHAANAHQSIQGKAPCYMYVFTRIPDGDFGLKIGAFHAAEIDFVFGGALGMSEGLPAKGDKKLMEIMSKHWVECK